MTSFVAVASVDEVPSGTGKTVTVGDRAVALFNVEGTFHAYDGVCLHRGGPVGDGDVEGGVVTCPWHGWQYDVATGAHVMDRSIGLPRHHVRIEDGRVLVALTH